MNRNKSRKSVSAGRRRFRKQADKSRERDTRKANVRGVKAQASRAKSAKQVSQSTPKPMSGPVQAKSRTGRASIAARPTAVNPQRQELERGRQLKQLHEQGLSLAELGRKFGCSKSLVRNLVLLASLSKELEQAYIQRKMGRKAVLKMARARKNQIESKTPVVTVGPQREASRKSAPVLSEEEREKRVRECARLIIDWFHSLELAPCDWEGFFQQVKYGLYGPFRWIFRQEAPKPHENNADEDPCKVIESCRVEDGNPNFVPDIINNAVTWLARWAQRVIPDRAMMEDAIDQARGQLLMEIRAQRWW